MFASRALTRPLSSSQGRRRGAVGCSEARNLSPLGEAFGDVCRCWVIVRLVAHTVVLGCWMWEDELRMDSLRRRSVCEIRSFLRSHIGIGVWRVLKSFQTES